MTGVSPLVTVLATQKLGKRTSKLVCSSIEITWVHSQNMTRRDKGWKWTKNVTTYLPYDGLAQPSHNGCSGPLAIEQAG
uniref:Uncharacterized protein n=1 Tax=Candidatus Kentrum sp. FM TaxID=2126340 RepID=A0A450TP12_9GAMM|nr:MAG: hypothetical protein BECKFM1743A_GA0114220_105141 [Candidatus Kentron sp. FM]VFK18883.1 MAG: hypothetical protein BECKFM1743B_GA0114221_105811 [Candidatus Kentron sp. FM]